jgi:hypothetical protein
MNSEKAKEIKKALECCGDIKEKCDNKKCYLFDKLEYHYCERQLKTDILTLINELESENERLSNTEIGELIKENEELEKQCEDWCEITLKKRNQIVELKERIAELEKEKTELLERGDYQKGYDEAVKMMKDTAYDCVKEAELKQFAEMLIEKKVRLGERFNIYDIDETLKEFIK